MKADWDKLKFLLLNTKGFFKSIEKEKDYWSILKFYVILVISVQVVSFLINIPLYFNNSKFLSLTVVGFATNTILAFVTPFVVSAVFHLGVLLFKAPNGYFNTFKPTIYGMAIFTAYGFLSSIVIGVISWFSPPNLDLILQGAGQQIYSLPATIAASVIGAVAIAHSLYGLIKGLSYFQKLSVGKSLVVIIIIPFVIIFVIGLIFGTGIAFILKSLGY